MGGLLPYISAPLPPARPPQYLNTSIPQYLNTMGMVRLTIPHPILPLPFHGEAADVPRVPPARPPQYLHTSIPSPTPSYLYLFMARRRMYRVYRPRGLLNTSIPQYHPPHHPTTTFSRRGGGNTAC